MSRQTWLVLMLFFWCMTASAQEPTLSKDSEDSFRRFMHRAQSGELGEDVVNANVALMGAQARVELIRRDGSPMVFVLTPRRSSVAVSRYFDIAPGENATAERMARVGRALDACFIEDPFQYAGLEESLATGPLPSVGEAWSYGGWQGVLRVLERRTMALASREYTVAVSVALAVGFVACLVLLWSANPPRAR